MLSLICLCNIMQKLIFRENNLVTFSYPFFYTLIWTDYLSLNRFCLHYQLFYTEQSQSWEFLGELDGIWLIVVGWSYSKHIFQLLIANNKVWSLKVEMKIWVRLKYIKKNKKGYIYTKFFIRNSIEWLKITKLISKGYARLSRATV